ncbi:MAG TPA: LPS assembly lipoprotein LptE [Myxococcales bacterium]|jgi:outer membrane lipopolysaccharide assembly protein LptE/RlpB
MRRVLASAILCAGLFACGYRFTAGGGALPGGARTLYVPVFKNATAEAGLEGPFTDALRQELARWGREGGELSDATAVGEITLIGGGPAIATNTFSPDTGVFLAVAASYQVVATVVVRVMKGGAQVAQTTVTGGEDYLPRRADVTANAPATGVLEAEANRRMALRRLAATLMKQAYQNLTGF